MRQESALLFPVTITNAKGKQVKTYPCEAMMTSVEKLKSLDEAQQYLQPGITLETLDAFAHDMTDNEAAEQLNSARDHLFTQRHERLKIRA